MLAYELYLTSKDSAPVQAIPIKKIFVRSRPLKIELDKRTLEEYGGSTLPETKLLQETISFPLSNQSDVGLPDRRTGTAAKRPYITFYGSYKNGKIAIQINGKKGKSKITFGYVAQIDGKVREEPFGTKADTLTIRLDTQHYRLGTMTLFEAYQKDGVVDKEGSLSYELFHIICNNFAKFCCEQKITEKLERIKRDLRFGLVILPHSMAARNETVEFVEGHDEAETEHFTDSFGTESAGYSSKTTQTAKFLSFDDRAFTINCTRGGEFYENLGIGRESLQRINLRLGDCFRIAGFLWNFIDLTDPYFTFERTNSGIYDQLRVNYQHLKGKAGASFVHKSIMKATCYKKTQAKLEVLLDENLTMDQLEGILQIKEFEPSGKRFPMTLETLIIKRRDQSSPPVWSHYLSAIQHLIHGIPMERNVLIGTFTVKLRENILLWIGDFIKGVDSTNRFFENSAFCVKLLTRRMDKMIDMNENEEYAFRIGRIAGRYVKYRRDQGQAARSSADILTYTKYDRDHLRHVYSKVSTGISLETSTSQTLNTQDTEMFKFMEDNAPRKEINDTEASEDYSYFFYRGVFSQSAGAEKT